MEEHSPEAAASRLKVTDQQDYITVGIQEEATALQKHRRLHTNQGTTTNYD